MMIRLATGLILSGVLAGPAAAQIRAGFPSPGGGYEQPGARWQPPFGSSEWELGVRVQNLPNGCKVSHIGRGSVAAQAGLETGDVILNVSGGPVGYINGRLYDLQDQLNRRADPMGRVNLRIRNVRDGRVRTIPVTLAPGNNVGPGPGPGPFPPIPPQPPIGGGFQRQVVSYYQTFLGRTPGWQETNYWSGILANGMTLGEFQANMVGSAEYFDRCGNTIPGFVDSIYRAYVGRPPLPAESIRWTRQLLTQAGGNRIVLMRQFLTELGKYP